MQLHTPSREAMDTAILVDGGFTFDPRKNVFIRAGQYDSPAAFAVAIPDLILGTFKNDDPNIYVGGWLDPRTNEVIIEAAQFVRSRNTAIRLGIERGQYSIMNMLTGDEIVLAPFAKAMSDDPWVNTATFENEEPF